VNLNVWVSQMLNRATQAYRLAVLCVKFAIILMRSGIEGHLNGHLKCATNVYGCMAIMIIWHFEVFRLLSDRL